MSDSIKDSNGGPASGSPLPPAACSGYSAADVRAELHKDMRIMVVSVEVDSMRFDRLVALRPEMGILGTCDLLHASRRSASIRQLFVPPWCRFNGVGRALVEKCLEAARRAGCETLGLTVAKDNADAKCFYLRLGFIIAYEYDEGTLCMCKILNPGGEGDDCDS